MSVDLSNTTIHHFPHAFLNKRSEPILVAPLEANRHQQLIEMYLAFEPRNSFNGLPPLGDAACVRWVEKMIATGINLVALCFDRGLVGHLGLFPIDRESCEMMCAVTPAYQKQGIGTEMTRSAIQLAHELGFEEIVLNVEARNHVARHVYEKCGFRYKSHSLIDELDMCLDLQRFRASTDAPVREIMNRRVISIGPDAPCRVAMTIFLNDGITTLPVVNENKQVIGMLSASDLLIEENILKKVGEVLTREVVTVQDGCPIARVVPLFRSRKLRCIPVLDHRMKLVGILGRRDILEHYRRRMSDAQDTNPPPER